MATLQPETPKNTVCPVLNNQERLEIIQLPAIKSKSGLTPGPTITLVPGWNFPDAEMWDKAKQNPAVQEKLKTKIKPSRAPEQNPEMVGHIMLVERPPVSKDSPLAALDEDDAIVMVDEMFHIPMLRTLLAEETRPSVAKALKLQLAKAETPHETKRIAG